MADTNNIPIIINEVISDPAHAQIYLPLPVIRREMPIGWIGPIDPILDAEIEEIFRRNGEGV